MRRLWGAADEMGGESWGVMFREDGRTLYQKGVGSLLPNAKYLMDQVRHSPAWCAHSRLATTGEVTRDNAHPFIITEPRVIVGMHNGIISNWYRYGRRGTVVDSEVIFQLVADEDWSTLAKLEGWGASCWMDERGQLFTWAANKQLYLRRDRPGWLLSSVPGALPKPGLLTQKDDTMVEWSSGDPIIMRRVALAHRTHTWIPGLQRWWPSSIKVPNKGKREWPYGDPDEIEEEEIHLAGLHQKPDGTMELDEYDVNWRKADKDYFRRCRRPDERLDG